MNIPSSTHSELNNTGLFRRFGIATVFIIYFLILVGGIVRTTGSGMGCPDWPKCFGYWIPPTSVDQLPADYQTIFQVAGKEIAEFSALKTWIEYINRLIGAVTGLMILITLLFSFKYRRSNPPAFWFSFVCFILVAIVGWLGSRVVATDLMPGMITIHMLGAVLVASAMIMAVSINRNFVLNLTALEASLVRNLQKFWWLGISLAFFQLILGTQVREEVDKIALKYQDESRDLWINELDWKFYLHRSMSTVYLVISYILYKKSQKLPDTRIRKGALVSFVFTLSALVAGVVLSYGDMPRYMQPIHLLIGTAICGIQVFLGSALYSRLVEIPLVGKIAG
jgi:cytochrome c oxidase assembly protein subunit 15